MVRLKVLLLFCVLSSASMFALASPAQACRDYDGHHNSNVPPDCGSLYAGSSGASDVDAAIDAVGLPYIFHDIAWRESGDDPTAVNPYSGACGPFQFLPSTAAYMGYSCYDLYDPYTAAQAAYELYLLEGLSPWAATAY